MEVSLIVNETKLMEIWNKKKYDMNLWLYVRNPPNIMMICKFRKREVHLFILVYSM